MLTPKELQKRYLENENIIKLLKEEKNTSYNNSEIIEISYDLQTGSYINAMKESNHASFKKNYTEELAKVILSLTYPETILEAGIGEATTLSGVLKNLPNSVKSYGFDISWSRVAYAKKWLQKEGFTNTTLCTGDLLNIPFSDNSIDIVYTSHSIEPNGGREKEILQELYRITKKYLILLEPAYELSNKAIQKRMDFHGYCKGLVQTSENSDFKIIHHSLFLHSANPLNPTALTIIEKNLSLSEHTHPAFVCPRFKTPLDFINNTLYSEEAFCVYPILGSIPCLRIENGIFASKYQEVCHQEESFLLYKK